MGLVPGNRVLLRAPNNPMLAACWFAVMKAGGIAVATMPLLRAKELAQIIDKAQVTHALCDLRLADELRAALRDQPAAGAGALLRRRRRRPASKPRWRATPTRFDNVATAADDSCLFAFTSGTTGQPKATMHFHRDVMAACAMLAAARAAAARRRRVHRQPAAGLHLRPRRAAAVPDERRRVDGAARAGPRRRRCSRPSPTFGATVLFTAPTSYRAMAEPARALRLSVPQGGTLRQCVSAGEALPAATRALWKDATGIELIDGIGATEMLHIFISADEAHARPGATGTVVPGYRACVIDDDGRPAAAGHGRQAGREGPDRLPLPRRRAPGQLREGRLEPHRRRLPDGRRRLLPLPGAHRRHDRLGRLQHRRARGRGGAAAAPGRGRMRGDRRARRRARPDRQGLRRAARRRTSAGDALARALQDFVKQAIAPYKYPRAIEFRSALPRTETGKLQRFRLARTAA